MEDVMKEKGVPEPRLYEVGYHILPTVAEEDIPGRVSDIKAAIESAGGSVVSDGGPSLMALAYPLPHVVANKRKYYTNAYFGWIKFDAEPAEAVAIKKALDADPNIIRFLIIKTFKDKFSAATERMAFMKETEGGDKGPAESAQPEPAAEGSADSADKEELDKTIDDLVIK